jgi:ubiquinone/menaquinone biosynthesis C-methylase UbiE
MNFAKDQLATMLNIEQFPLSLKYDPEWVLQNEMGPNTLWLTEGLCQVMDLKPGMRVLDMGCGKAMSSIFLAKEFDVQVWTTDLWIKAADNWERIREAGMKDHVFPIHAEAHALPYAEGFFDAILSLDSFFYYGTDEFYLEYFVKFVRPGGQIGKIDVGLLQDLPDKIPDHLRDWPLTGYHTHEWWRRHWERIGLVEIELADDLPGGARLWQRWYKLKAALRPDAPEAAEDLAVFRADQGRYLGLVRTVARRKGAKS